MTYYARKKVCLAVAYVLIFLLAFTTPGMSFGKRLLLAVISGPLAVFSIFFLEGTVKFACKRFL